MGSTEEWFCGFNKESMPVVHSENDGARFLNRGAEGSEESTSWYDLTQSPRVFLEALEGVMEQVNIENLGPLDKLSQALRQQGAPSGTLEVKEFYERAADIELRAFILLGQLCKLLDRAQEFWDNGTPIASGSLLANEIKDMLQAVMRSSVNQDIRLFQAAPEMHELLKRYIRDELRPVFRMDKGILESAQRIVAKIEKESGSAAKA